MLRRGDRVLIAVSGGPDSLALLAALAELAPQYEVTLHAAHLNHQLRGDEALRDQHAAEAMARQHGVSCVVGHVELVPGPNLEARARAARYAFLNQTAVARDCTKIATGHTLDDQAETVLMRLLRGSGWDGLRGIHPVLNDRIIRPLICCGRAQVLAFLRARALSFTEDSSNLDRRFLRNRIRHEVLPALEAINPSVRRALTLTASIASDESEVLEQSVRSVLATRASADGGLPITALDDVPLALRPRLVRAWLRDQRGTLDGIAATHVLAIVSLAVGTRPNSRWRLPGGAEVVREYGTLFFRVAEHSVAAEPSYVLVPGLSIRLASGWQLRADSAPIARRWDRPDDLWSALADAEALVHPLTVRTRRSGDRVRPLGLGGHRKLQDIFVDRKVPSRLRATCPVVEVAGRILWVPGVVRSDAALVSPRTRVMLRLVALAPGMQESGIAGA